MPRRSARPLYRARRSAPASTITVRRSRLTGRYFVDQAASPRDYPQEEKIPGRLPALRAAQHRAARYRTCHPQRGAVPYGPSTRKPFSTASPVLGTATLGKRGDYVFGYRHHGGTFTVTVPASFHGEELVSWWAYGYRSRRGAVRGFQAALRGAPSGFYSARFCHVLDQVG